MDAIKNLIRLSRDKHIETNSVEFVDLNHEEAIAPLGGTLPQNPDPEKLTEFPQEGKPTEQVLTPLEISNILDNATQGICPTLAAIPALLNSSYAYPVMEIIKANPDWGINLADYLTADQETAQRSKLRSQRRKELKSFVLNQQQPPLEFLQDCWQDPVLKIELKKVAPQQNWDIQTLTPG